MQGRVLYTGVCHLDLSGELAGCHVPGATTLIHPPGQYLLCLQPTFFKPTGGIDLALNLELPQAGRHRLIPRAGVNCMSRGENGRGSLAYFWVSAGAWISSSGL